MKIILKDQPEKVTSVQFNRKQLIYKFIRYRAFFLTTLYFEGI